MNELREALREHLHSLTAQMKATNTLLNSLPGADAAPAKAPAAAPHKPPAAKRATPMISAAARKKIAEKQKQRWARHREALAAAAKTSTASGD